MKFGIRVPSFKKRIAARTSWKRAVRHNLGLKAPRGWGWVTNPKKAAYNRVYNRTTVGLGSILGPSRRRSRGPTASSAAYGCLGVVVLFAVFGSAIGGLLVGMVPYVVTATLLAIAYLAVKVWQSHARQIAEARAKELQAAAAAESQALAAAARASRLDELARRFGVEAAERIVAGRYWAGATSEMLLEALGTPTHIRERVLKTKTKQTYCYFPTGRDRFRLRIHLEDGCVVGWDGQ